MWTVQSCLVVMVANIVFVSICHSQVYHYQKQKDHPGGSLFCGQPRKGQCISMARKTHLSWENCSGKIRSQLPESRKRVCPRKAISYPLFPVQATVVQRGTQVTFWSPYLYCCRTVTSSVLRCDLGPLLQSPMTRAWLGAVGEQSAGYCPCRHVRQCDDKDLLWEALTSFSGYAHRTGSGHRPLGDLRLATDPHSPIPWKWLDEWVSCPFPCTNM